MNIDHFLEDIRHYAAPVELAKILHGLNDDDVNGLEEEINQAEADCQATLIKLANKASKQTTTQNDIDPQIAEAESEMWLIRTIRDAAEIHPEAATWLLNRRFRID